MLTQQCAFGREMSNLSPADSQGKVSSEFCGIQTEQQLTSATEKILMKWTIADVVLLSIILSKLK